MHGYKTVTGYIPGVIGRITELHARYYSEHWGFGSITGDGSSESNGEAGYWNSVLKGVYKMYNYG